MNIDTCNFSNCSILPYRICIFKLGSSAQALNPATQIDEYQNTDLALGDDPSVVLDQYLDGEELEELTMEARNVIDNDLPRTSQIDVFDDFQFF